MKNKTKRYRNKTALIVSLFLFGGFGHAAKYDMSSDDFFAPSQEEDRFQFDSPTGEQVAPFFEFMPETDQQDLAASYKKIVELIKDNRLDEAQTQTHALLKRYPEEAAFYNLQALIHLRQQNQPSATASFRDALKLAPDNVTALQGLAFIALTENDLKTAGESIDKAIKVNAHAPLPYIMKANIAFRQNRLDEVEQILNEAMAKVGGNLDSELLVANNLVKLYELKGQASEVLTLAQAMNQRHPNQSQVLSLLARAQIVNKRFDEAEQTLKNLVAKDARDLYNRLLLAKLGLYRSADAEATERLIDEALAIEPDNANAITLKTLSLLQQKKYDEALTFADRLEKKSPESQIGKILKAEAYGAQAQYDQALSYYQQAYWISPEPNVLNRMVGLLSAQGKSGEAIRLLSREIDKTPQNAQAHFLIANLYLEQQNLAKAEAHYRAVLKENAENPVVLNNLAMIYYKQNDPKSLEMAEQAYRQAPDSAAIADTYGIVLLQRGQSREALTVLQKAAELAPNVAEVQFNLAKAHQANGNKATAINILEKIVADSGTFENKQEAADLLNKLKGD